MNRSLTAALLLAALAACEGGAPIGSGGEPGGESKAGLGPGASLGGRRPFPDDNPWNRDVSGDPVDPNSATLIASCGADRPLREDGTAFGAMAQFDPFAFACKYGLMVAWN